jgi:hypothetical protein
MGRYQLKIEGETFYNNGKIILKSLGSLEQDIRKAFGQSVDVKTIERSGRKKTPYTGIKADDLNKVLRKCVSGISHMNGETHVKNGVFFPVSKAGFDFSIYDKEYNYSRLYNYYLGVRGTLHGDERIINDLSRKEREGKGKREWNKRIRETINKVGGYNIDYVVEKENLTVVGEFQFGNWALAYRDIIRLLNANADPGIDFYIYITATGTLQSLLSDQTVNFKLINDIFEENSSLIQIPTWIIGLDVSVE